MLSYLVLLDSCVLFGSRLTDVLLYAANNEMYKPLWSDRILAAVEREVPKQRENVSAEQIARRIARMREVFPEALVTGYEHLTAELRTHPEDRHVLAAAVQGGADVLVTNNVRHFPLPEMERHDIARMTADEFLLDLLGNDARTTLRSVEQAFRARRKPPESLPAYVKGLEESGLWRFAREVSALLPPALGD